MPDLTRDFRLLIRKSCSSLDECEGLFDIPRLKPLLADSPPNEQTRILREFLLAAADHAIGRAEPEEQKIIKAAIADIGLRPRRGKPLTPREMEAVKILKLTQRTIRSEAKRQVFARTLVDAVTDFLHDEEALGRFIEANCPKHHSVPHCP